MTANEPWMHLPQNINFPPIIVAIVNPQLVSPPKCKNWTRRENIDADRSVQSTAEMHDDRLRTPSTLWDTISTRRSEISPVLHILFKDVYVKCPWSAQKAEPLKQKDKPNYIFWIKDWVLIQPTKREQAHLSSLSWQRAHR